MKASEFKKLLREQRPELKSAHTKALEPEDRSSTFSSIYLMDKIPEGVGFWRPEIGKTHVFDILPFLAGPTHPRVIRGEIPENSVEFRIKLWRYEKVGEYNKYFVAPYRNFGRKDPFKDYMSSFRGRMPGDEYAKVAPKDRLIFLVYVRTNQDEMNKGIQIFDIATFFIGEDLDTISSDPTTGEAIPYTDLEIGKSLRVKITETTYPDKKTDEPRKGFRYVGLQLIDRPSPIPDNVIEQIFPLDSIIHMEPTYDEIMEAWRPEGKQKRTEETSKTQPESNTEQEEEDIDERKFGVSSDDGKDSCPFGHTFGIDTDKKDECDKCVKFDRCDEKHDEIVAEEKKKQEQQEESKQEEKQEEEVKQETQAPKKLKRLPRKNR